MISLWYSAHAWMPALCSQVMIDRSAGMLPITPGGATGAAAHVDSSQQAPEARTCHLPPAGAAAVYLSEQQLSSLITTVLGKLQAGGVKADVTRSYVQTVAQLRCVGAESSSGVCGRVQHGTEGAQAGAATGRQ